MQSEDNKRELLSPPGDTIMDTLKARGIGIIRFAEMMQISTVNALDLIEGEMEIDFRLAQRLAHVLDIHAQFWMNREKIYRDKLKELNR